MKRASMQAFGNRQSWCAVRNADSAQNDEAVIYIYDEIGGWGIWAIDFIAALARITAPVIRVRIHSPGGSVHEAIAMHNALRKHPAHTIVEIDSMAASAASFLAQAGDERIIAENAQMMIHDITGMVWGSEDEIRAYADQIPSVRDAVVATYAYRTKISEAEIRQMLAKGTDIYLSAQQAVDQGFVDRIDSLADMGVDPNGIVPDETPEPPAPGMTDRLDLAGSLRDLATIYGLPQGSGHNKAGSGRRIQGKGEPMNQKELIAQLQQTGIDVLALQGQVETLTRERDTASNNLKDLQERHDALTAVTGDHTPEQVKASLDAANRYTTSLVDSIVAGRRLLKACGDSDDEVAADKAMWAKLDIAQLEAEAKNMAQATDGMARQQLAPAGQQGTDDPAADDADKLADNIVSLGTRRRHTHNG